MRHKYSTRALVLARIPAGEESITASLLTEDFGLIRARSQGARKGSAKMSAGMQTLSESDVTLLRGKDIWRMAGAVLETNWARELDAAARKRAARVLELADRLIRGEHADPELFLILTSFLRALPERTEDEQDAAEMLAVLRMLHALGVDAGDTYGEPDDYSSGSEKSALARAIEDRSALIARINHGITESGL
ncbi:MAG: repair protein RecO, repair protein RecO [Parcubacteria group bacterium]|nr:repair protein RecO, repair protein RecO [Parcubacteria group bacterium]